MNCDAARDRLEEYALGLLDTGERERIERHLAGCPECERKLAEIQDLLGQLPVALATASGEAPPATSKERLLRVVRDGTLAGSERQSVPSLPRRVRTWWTPARVAAIAVLVALVVSLGWGFQLNQALSEERELRARIAGLVGQQEIVLEIVDGSDTVRRVLLPPAGVDSDAYGKVFTRPGFEEVVVMAARLPDAPEGTTYHVWLTAGDRTRLAGTLRVNDEGFGLLVIEAEEPGPDYSSALVTLQSEGATEPGDTVVLTWEEE